MNWLNALTTLQNEQQGYVLLTVLETRGSSPRGTGTKMVVSETECFDTIGGGALEYQCIETARELLLANQSSGDSPQHSLQRTETFNLGKDLKQCCGGVVSVFFEVFPANDFVLNIFGAGHISQALIKILTDIDCMVNLFDSREDLLQAYDYPSNIRTHLLTAPEISVEACIPTSYFLIMTHDHALDQQLCEAVLSRADAVYCGVIGSRSKGIKFTQRLLKKGFSQDEVNQLTCPMGLNNLNTKIPMEIAISIAAELIIIRDSQVINLKIQNADNVLVRKIIGNN